MKYLKKYKLFESNDIVDIKSDVIDILSPISDPGNIEVEVSSYIMSHPRKSGGVSVLEIGLRDHQSYDAYVKPIKYKEELERLKEYLSVKGYRFDNFRITHGVEREWNNLFNDESFDEEISVHWIELSFFGGYY